MIRHIVAVAAIGALAWTALDVPAPRLIGYGCDNPPTVAGFTYRGPRLAHDESDYRGACRAIEPLWSN